MSVILPHVTLYLVLFVCEVEEVVRVPHWWDQLCIGLHAPKTDSVWQWPVDTEAVALGV